jgi:hypothetical protein
MDFSSEHFVKLYTRDSATWELLGWEGQAVFMFLYRKADAAGTLKLGGLEPWELVARVSHLPEPVARAGMERLLLRQWVVRDENADRLVLPRFVEANKAAKSDAQRAREYRARKAVTKRDASVTTRDATVTTVTDASRTRHDASQNVTPSYGPNGSSPLRAIGHRWYAEVFGRDDYTTGGRWDEHYCRIAVRPDSEKRDVARTIQRQLGKPDARRIMNPKHIADYWAGYAEGKPPGDYARNGDHAPLPGAAEVAAAKAAFDHARARYRAAADEDTKAARMSELRAADEALKATKARFAWTG